MIKKKVLLLGATGMAGHITYLKLKDTRKYEILPVVYRQKLTEDSIILDVSNKNDVAALIKEYQPDFIINCIGILIKGANQYPDNAIFINSFLPHFLARTADEIGAKVIQISTDCVFSGKKGNYTEADFKDADDIYGRSKALGEIISDKHLTLRTSIIGPELKNNGEGLFNWFMNQTGEISGFTQAFWGGITTVELANAIIKALDANLAGLIQVTNGDKIAKYDLVNLFKEIWNKSKIVINKIDGKVVDKSMIKSERFDFNIPSYKEMLVNQKAWMDDHVELYQNIY